MARTNEERAAVKAARMKEKLGRMPINDVVLKVHDGIIDIKDVFSAIEGKLNALQEVKNG